MVIAILIAGNSIEGDEGGGDFFAADKVWLYVTLLTIGYRSAVESPSRACAIRTGASAATATPTTSTAARSGGRAGGSPSRPVACGGRGRAPQAVFGVQGELAWSRAR